MVGAVLQWHILSINKNPNLVPGISLILEILIVFFETRKYYFGKNRSD
tara:strand:- start:23140 stop:23283 length:144 start_codon:yes stop_codon:yes gene_type:complete